MDTDLREAVKVIKSGGILLYPTDTVWGIGCDATNPTAISRIFALKRRADSKALISLVGSVEMLSQWVDLDSNLKEYISGFQRPTTVIYQGVKGLANNLISEDGSAAIRITSESFSGKLCELTGVPIVSTSANISGDIAPRTFAEIKEEIKTGVDYVALTGRKYKPGKPSRIIKIQNGKFISIRE